MLGNVWDSLEFHLKKLQIMAFRMFYETAAQHGPIPSAG